MTSRGLRLLRWFALGIVLAAPAIASEPAIEQGRALFQQYCASCHGAEGRGGGPDSDLFPSPPRDLHAGFLERYDDDSLIRRLRDGRALPLVLDPAALRRHADEVEAIVTHLQRLPGIDWSSVEPGWAAYVDRCEVCHGPTGDGPPEVETATAPTDLSAPDFHAAHRDRDLVDAVRRHGGDAPALNPAVGEAEAQRIAAFVALLSPGFSSYSRFCANCHADDGRGSATLGAVPGDILPLPSFAFDAAFFAARSPAELRARVWHMLESNKPSMPHFRVVLSDADARAILGYLRSVDAAEPAQP